MNGPAWALLAFHLAVLAVFLYFARRPAAQNHRPSAVQRLAVGVIGLMALAPCIIIPVTAHPGSQPWLARLVMFLSLPAVAFVASTYSQRKRRSDRS